MALLDVVLPARCAACGAGETLFCSACRYALLRIRPPLCARCGAPTAWPVERCAECAGRRIPFRHARAAVAYEGAARALVAAWKERGLRRLAGEAASLVAETVSRPTVAAIAYVPGDPERTRWRGQNTAQALAAELAARWDLPLVDVLVRARPVRRQPGLPREERRANVRGSFRTVAEPPRTVVLVDDVYTTGATAAAVATELRRAGARAVDVVTFARAILRAA
ncbi:MAG: ComF family protein [Thermoleophilia bacterium]|nr:ComF family protein [Thermoleophilia bacterium]MDQ3858396.1 double zinc ribbon domain-containing protein [Actinomycetota bacterium]